MVEKPPSMLSKKLGETIRYYLNHDPDKLFGFLRFFRPNVRLGPISFVTRFNDVQEVLSRPDVFQVTYAPMMNPSVGPFMLARDNTTINQRDKGIMLSLMSRDDLPAVRKTVRRIADDLVSGLEPGKPFNAVSDFSRISPVIFTQQHFGFTGVSIDKMQQWSMSTQMDMFHNYKKDPKIHQNNIEAGRQMHVHLSQLLKDKRKAINAGCEANDVFSRLVRTQFPDEIEFDDERILSNIMGLLVGGIETTAQAAVHIVNELLKRPEICQRAIAAKDDDDVFFRYCWEALRFNPINTVLIRHCNEEYRVAKSTWRAHTFKAGDKVLVATRSAMQDAKELTRPKCFDVNRPQYHYMHTGYGLHTCLGDQINKVQVPEMVRALLSLPDLRAVGLLEKDEASFPCDFQLIFGLNSTLKCIGG